MLKQQAILVLSFMAAVAQPVYAGSCGSEEATLRAIKLESWPEYYRNQDASGLADFLHEDFRIVAADGSITLRSEELAWVAKSPWNPTDFTYTIKSVVCPARSLAIIVGEGRFKAQDKTKGAWIEHRYVSSNVLVNTDGEWHAASSHISGEQSRELQD